MRIEAGEYLLEIAPERGGSIVRFDWRGRPVMRPACGASILDVSCFPLVPFSNRIANGRFRVGSREIVLSPNFPGSDHPHPLHGFGWLAEWRVVATGPGMIALEHRYPRGEWPWSYRVVQTFRLNAERLTIVLDLHNEDDDPMPAGLGLHPYFLRDNRTRYQGLHRGEWTNDRFCLPATLDCRSAVVDWWNGAPVSSRVVDTLYTGREGPLVINWDGHDRRLAIEPSNALGCTVVYVPAGEDFFCVEPVSHQVDALNAPGSRNPMQWLGAGRSMSVEVTFRITAG